MPNKTTIETCPLCDGFGLENPMMSPNDPANGTCALCGGDGLLRVFDHAQFERAKKELNL